MAPPSISVTLVIICVSLSISEAFLAFTSDDYHHSSSSSSSFATTAAHSTSRLWRLFRSVYDTGENDESYDHDQSSDHVDRFGRWRRSSSGVTDGDAAASSSASLASASSSTDDVSSVILTGMSPGPGNADASFENGILTLIKKEKMKVKLFGAGFSLENRLKFDSRKQEAGTDCEHQIESDEFTFDDGERAEKEGGG